MYDGFGFV